MKKITREQELLQENTDLYDILDTVNENIEHDEEWLNQLQRDIDAQQRLRQVCLRGAIERAADWGARTADPGERRLAAEMCYAAFGDMLTAQQLAQLDELDKPCTATDTSAPSNARRTHHRWETAEDENHWLKLELEQLRAEEAERHRQCEEQSAKLKQIKQLKPDPDEPRRAIDRAIEWMEGQDGERRHAAASLLRYALSAALTEEQRRRMNGLKLEYPMNNAQDLTRSEEKMKKAILATLEAKDENGDKIFTQNNQWWAVFRVLNKRDICKNMKVFDTIMTNWGMDETTPPCKYESIKKASKDATGVLKNDVDTWHNYLNRTSDPEKKQILVAMELMKQLGEG